MPEEEIGTAGVTDTTGGQDAGNPAWQEIYGVLPDSLHNVVRPALEKWEQGTQAKFQEYAEKTKAYEPYQEFVSNNIPPEQIQQALAIANLIDTNPKQFMEQMQAFFGEQQPQTPQQTPQETKPTDSETFEEKPFDLENDPRFKQIKEQQDTIANFLATEHQRKQQEAANQQLDAELARLKEKHGEYDEPYVIALAASGMDLEKAVEQYHTLENNIRNRPAADANVPSILTPGGGQPSEQLNVAGLSKNDRMNLVMNALAQANGQG